MKELCVGWMNDSKKGAFKRPSYTYLWRPSMSSMRERDELDDTYYCHRDRVLSCRSFDAMNRPMGPLVENRMACCKFDGSEGAMKRGGPV